MDNKYLSVKELAEYIGRTESAIYKWLRSGRVPGSVLIGKGRGHWQFSKREIDKCIEKGSLKIE